MKQYIVFFLMISTFLACTAQTKQSEFTYDHFEKQILAYQPDQGHLSDKDYNHGIMILQETKKAVNNDPNTFNLSDYYNVLSCFISLNESESAIFIAFEKFKNSEGSCEYLLSEDLFKSPKYDIIRQAIDKAIDICKNATTENPKPFDIIEYAQEHKLDPNLVKLIHKISLLDAQYRLEDSTDWAKQTPIDLANQKTIDSLYQVHQSYIGKTLVGEKYAHVCWAVVQHAPLEMMERYLPIMQTAVKHKELGVTPFKMLLDRYYGLKYGYQLFGTQIGFGFKMADEKTRQAIELKYGID